MISEILTYAANRATSGAVESISKHAVWFVAGSLVLLLGSFFAILAAFWLLEPLVGPVEAAGLIAASCFIVAIMLFTVPSISQYLKRQSALRKAETTDPVAETIKAVDDEAREVVDYFGSAQVVLSAFMLGLGAARQMRGNATT